MFTYTQSQFAAARHIGPRVRPPDRLRLPLEARLLEHAPRGQIARLDERKCVQAQVSKDACHSVQQHRAEAASLERVTDVDGANGAVLVSRGSILNLTH